MVDMGYNPFPPSPLSSYITTMHYILL